MEIRACGGSAEKLAAAIACKLGPHGGQWLDKQTCQGSASSGISKLRSVSQRCRSTEPMANYDSSSKKRKRNEELVLQVDAKAK